MFVPSRDQRKEWNRISYERRRANMGKDRRGYHKPSWVVGSYHDADNKAWYESNNKHAYEELRRIRKAAITERLWDLQL